MNFSRIIYVILKRFYEKIYIKEKIRKILLDFRHDWVTGRSLTEQISENNNEFCLKKTIQKLKPNVINHKEIRFHVYFCMKLTTY